MGLSKELQATEKQVLWLADLLVALGRPVNPSVIDEMRSLSRDDIRIRYEKCTRALAKKTGERYPFVPYVFRVPKQSGRNNRA